MAGATASARDRGRRRADGRGAFSCRSRWCPSWAPAMFLLSAASSRLHAPLLARDFGRAGRGRPCGPAVAGDSARCSSATAASPYMVELTTRPPKVGAQSNIARRARGRLNHGRLRSRARRDLGAYYQAKRSSATQPSRTATKPRSSATLGAVRVRERDRADRHRAHLRYLMAQKAQAFCPLGGRRHLRIDAIAVLSSTPPPTPHAGT